jgi:hypothetical protein
MRGGYGLGSWNDVIKEVYETQSQYDYVRRKYIKELSEYTGRNTIAYYSSWLNKQANNIDINDADMTGFMNCVHGMNCSKGLDLVLHTPGGSPAAAEAIVNYLRVKFNSDIRVIVPQLAMSAGTMIACASKEIIMGNQSSLGPIDPQFNGIPAYNIMMEFEEAKKDLEENPNNAQYWAIKLQQYPAAFMKTAIDAIQLSGQLVEEWLGTCMYDKNNPKDKEIIDNIVAKLNEHDDSKIHGRHLNAEFCKNIGLKIRMMEDDGELQDKILSLHHAYMITLDATPVLKIIENQNKKSLISNMQVIAR